MKDRLLVGIIREYIKSGEPIGSSFLKSRQNLSVSSATIRNYFKILEKEGALFQPHASSGRIPTQSSLHSYWRKVLGGLSDSLVRIDKSAIYKLSLKHGVYCVTIPIADNLLEEIIRSGEYIILRFSSFVSALKFSDKMFKFLEAFVDMRIEDIIKISSNVGANDLSRSLIALHQSDFEHSCDRFGAGCIRDILYDDDEIFLDVFHARALFKYGNGVYFNSFVPSGYMAVIHDAEYDSHKARMMCVGNLTRDYESFYRELDAASFA